MSMRIRLLLLTLWVLVVAYGIAFSLCARDMCIDTFDPSCGPRPSMVFYYSTRPEINEWLDAAFWPQGRLLEITGRWKFVREPF